MTEKDSPDTGSNQPEYHEYDINKDLNNFIFTTNVEHHNDRINEVASQHVHRVYVKNQFLDEEITIGPEMETRMDELELQYEELGLYRDEHIAQYVAHKQVFYEYLAEYELRDALLGTLTREDTNPEYEALSRLYLHEHITRYDMEIGWHKVISTLNDADIMLISGEEVGSLHDFMDRKQANDRKSIMDTILSVGGTEDYMNVTGEMQHISQHQTLMRAWAVAQMVAIPRFDGDLEQEYRDRNREVLHANLDETTISDEKKAEIYDSLSWLL